MLTSLQDMRFRSSPLFDLKQLDDLTAEQREPFKDLESDPDFYGLFVPKPPLTINLKSVGRQTAALFQSLATPSCLAERLLSDDEDIVELVLDGILEIESGEDFVSGADALPIICPSNGVPDFQDAVGRLSQEALLHAQDLETTSAFALTSALYFYHRMPLSPFWKARFPNSDAILAHLGTDRGPLRSFLDRHWIEYRQRAGWMSWSSILPMDPSADEATYKMYVSPRPERIREVFEIVVRVLSDFPRTQFKIGDSAVGLLRPDKLVTYFRTREQMEEVAQILHRELAGCDAHGVPFSASLDDTGLLSWGVDPPANDRALKWLGRESWRMWVVKKLGSALSIAKTARSAQAVEPWRFAIERVRRQGVEVETWTPSPALWSKA